MKGLTWYFFSIIEYNRLVYILLSALGLFSFVIYGRWKAWEKTVRKLPGENAWKVLIPVFLWMIFEIAVKMLVLHDESTWTIPEQWLDIAKKVSVILIIIMCIWAFADASVFAIFNIIGNLYIVYMLARLSSLYMMSVAELLTFVIGTIGILLFLFAGGTGGERIGRIYVVDDSEEISAKIYPDDTAVDKHGKKYIKKDGKYTRI